ncbi:MAG: DNA repair protein RecN [Pikeienuella sp.]|uniref:DNA repair protein RecN n=1 Tax=Pikeienuella sp. TaxID=2831957 RepID=UPI00391D2250
MLESLEISDIVLIERLALEFGPGLTVFTGETGAGKSILLDALGFALGFAEARGLVRAGAAEGAATAILRVPFGHPARAIMAEAGLEADADELILRRVASAADPSRAYVNDRRVNAETLRALGEALVEVHGQHDDRGLLNARGHRALLDAFAGAEPSLSACRAAHGAWRREAAALEAAEATLAEATRERETLAHFVAELEAFAPEPGEDAALDARRRAMQGAARIREDVARALALLSEGAEGALFDASRRLAAAAGEAEGRLDGPLDALDRAKDALSEAVAGVETAMEAMEFDPLALERAEERLFALRKLARKHDCAPDDLAALAGALSARLARIEAGEGEIAALRARAKAAKAAHREAAAALSALRLEAAGRLEAAVAAELPALKMERARFHVSVESAEPGPEGAEEVTFLIAANPGAAPAPLARVASGGELSRLLLALKVALSAAGGAGAMIFDEIDRGVGGATADAVGRRLARLARGAGAAQVLVVTHSPQVAAWGDVQFRIEKRVEAGAARTEVRRLAEGERAEEIARMLAGGAVTAEARAAASALLAAAG